MSDVRRSSSHLSGYPIYPLLIAEMVGHLDLYGTVHDPRRQLGGDPNLLYPIRKANTMNNHLSGMSRDLTPTGPKQNNQETRASVFH